MAAPDCGGVCGAEIMDVPDWMIKLAEEDGPMEIGEISISSRMRVAGSIWAFSPDADEPADFEAVYSAMERQRRIELIALERWNARLMTGRL